MVVETVLSTATHKSRKGAWIQFAKGVAPEDEFTQAGRPADGQDGGQLGFTAFEGQSGVTPVQVSAMSHGPATALHTAVFLR